MNNSTDVIVAYFAETARLMGRLDAVAADVARAAEACIAALSSGGKVMFCGNGGSAADAQHLAAELMGRFLFERDPLPALALTLDASALTAIANDYGYEHVFARQIRGMGRRGDLLVGLSTSGHSANVVKAFEIARQMGIVTIGLTGASGGALEQHADILIAVPHGQTSHIQEAHITIGHLICGIVESAMRSPPR
ncbi:D-sedoheptulose 7-phosphate isomerase [Ancylobacter aquaticus]|uniref:Phosphoheptose isomerase n=1 Tax=Ancylobacter aquaticus TaxID=100 RepID=A0A4R1I6P8_ANCAQ|nr:SIS domain-containing protein [Ancylobacter aquaticus]TCK28359.1 D-sedoheptulose 7-phosphate isomerase [Ancylobacter aquaticus]